MGRIVHP